MRWAQCVQREEQHSPPFDSVSTVGATGPHCEIEMKAHPPEKWRITPELCLRVGIPEMLGTRASDGMQGFFVIRGDVPELRCIVSVGEGWEHVSVSRFDRCPTWEEMCLVKDEFWGPEEAVMQLHPPHSEYVNRHPYCLHLWRPTKVELPRPPINHV